MSACEKCWRDAGGDPDRYSELLKERKERACSPEEQAGEYATECPTCKRMTVHQYAGNCMACGASPRVGDERLIDMVNATPLVTAAPKEEGR